MGEASPHTRAPGRNSRPGFAAIRPRLRAPARLDPWTSVMSTLRPLLPTPLFLRLRSSRFHSVAASCGATGASVPADAGDCFPGPLRYGAASTGDTPRLAGALDFLLFSWHTSSSRFFRAAVTLRADASSSRLHLRLTFIYYFRQPRRRHRLALLGSGSIRSLSLSDAVFISPAFGSVT